MTFCVYMTNIENFESYSQFKSLKDFNNQIEMWLAEYKSIFTKSELIALKRLIRFSAKIPGICTARINTILKATVDTMGGVSRSTFKRMLCKAKEIGLLVVFETMRANKSQSSNLYIFQRYHTIEPPQTKGEQEETASNQEKNVEQLNHPKTSNLYFNKTDIHNRQEKEIDHTYLPDYVNKSFVEIAKYYFNAFEIYKLWLRVLNAYKRAKISRPLPDVMDVIIKAFKQTIFKYKTGQIKKSFDGYFYRLCEDFLLVEKRKEAVKNHPILYNWLEA